MIRASIIKDSICGPHRLRTFELEYPRFIHSEFMTHRMLSRNASSSRALPAGKLQAEALGPERASPVLWGAEQKGMQTGGEIAKPEEAAETWATAAAWATDPV